MKNNKKTPFFIKLKTAIFNFDKYQKFAEEKLSNSIMYYLKLMLLFAVVITIVTLINFNQLLNRGKAILKNEIPEFYIENNILVLQGEPEQNEILKGDEFGYYCVIINTEKDNLNEIENSGYQTAIAFLRNKVTIKNSSGIEKSISYENIAQKFDINGVNKETVMNFLNNKVLYFIVLLISFIYFYVTYFISVFIDILLLSLVGFLISRIINVRFKYKVIFNMSVYALTLSVILYLIYIVVNTFTGFTVKYFEIAYNVIGYIYLITAMLMIKSDLIKQQIELTKVVEEQRKISKEENQEEKKQEEKKDKKKEEKDKKDDNQEKDNPAPAEN